MPTLAIKAPPSEGGGNLKEGGGSTLALSTSELPATATLAEALDVAVAAPKGEWAGPARACRVAPRLAEAGVKTEKDGPLLPVRPTHAPRPWDLLSVA